MSLPLGPFTAPPAGTLAGPWLVTGLPPGPAGVDGRPLISPNFVADVRYQYLDPTDGLTKWTEWGSSDAFQTLNLWQSGEFVTHFDFQVERPEGESTVMQSYRDFGGFNWIKSARVEPAGVDASIGSGSVSLHRAVGDASLSPLVLDSVLNLNGGTYAPALDFGREVLAAAAMMLPGTEPDAGDWVPLLRGIADDIEWPRKTGDVTVPFRDYSGALADTMMRSQQRYGSDSGVDAAEVMQDYVDTHMGAGQFTITDATTGARFMVTDWTPSDVFVWEGLQQVALMWGGKELRQVEAADEALLTVIEPDRTKDTPDYEIGPNVYIDCTAISTAGKYLRTIVRGRAVDKATGVIITSQLPAEEDVGDDPLVQLYGKLFYQFDEDEAKGIDTQAELDAMVAAIYADLSTPPIPLEIETKFCPFARVGDLVRWSADTVLRDQSLDAAVLLLKHNFTAPGVGRTLWLCAGKPKGRYATYRQSGVEVAGIGRRPAIFNKLLTFDTGTRRFTQTTDFNPQVIRYKVYDRVGASPLVGGIPDERYAQGEYFATQRVVSWSAAWGEHFVLTRAFADSGRFVDSLTTVTAVNPDAGETPSDVAGTPLLARGGLVGILRTVNATWENTNVDSAIELEYYYGDALPADEPGAIVSLAAGVSSHAVNLGTPQYVRLHLRYTEGTGMEGPWSAFSPTLFVI